MAINGHDSTENSCAVYGPAQIGLGALEWPTLGLAAAIYGGWVLATLYHARLPMLLLVAVGGWLTAWHGSLQHEVIHDHPTPWRGVNTAMALPPLSLWLPFDIYRRSHRIHHVLEHLTVGSSWVPPSTPRSS
jgi:fatty acid desaturase